MEKKECPIVPDQAITFNFGEDGQSFMVAALTHYCKPFVSDNIFTNANKPWFFIASAPRLLHKTLWLLDI